MRFSWIIFVAATCTIVTMAAFLASPILSNCHILSLLALFLSTKSSDSFSSSPVLISPRKAPQSPLPLEDICSSRRPRTTLFADSASTMSIECKEATKEDFRGKSVLLTGASGGLGRAFALQLTRSGVDTLILSARKKEALAKVQQECASIDSGVKIHILTCDLADPNSVSQLATDALNVCPAIDVLINNGGVSSRSRFLDTTLEVDQQVMQINFLSGAALAKAVSSSMVSSGKGGRIIWVSSVQGLVGIPNRSSYAASKFAVQGYCESIRSELAADGITVHTASPGYIRTNLSNSAITGDGTAYGKTDPTTAAGADPNEVAVTILDQSVQGQVDFVVAATLSAKVAIWLRLLCPALLRYSLDKRYAKSQQETKSKDD